MEASISCRVPHSDKLFCYDLVKNSTPFIRRIKTSYKCLVRKETFFGRCKHIQRIRAKSSQHTCKQINRLQVTS